MLYFLTSLRVSDLTDGVILVVDDEPLVRFAIARSLKQEGYDAIEAADGQEALDLLANRRFDLVLTDLKMPKVDGADLVAQIRANWPEIPVILMSSYLSEKGRKLVSAGSAEFLQKPIDRSLLIANAQRFASP